MQSASLDLSKRTSARNGTDTADLALEDGDRINDLDPLAI